MPEHDPPRTERLALYMRERVAEKAAREKAVRLVEQWNAELKAGQGAMWSPTIRAATLAGVPWLDVYCPGCQTSRAIDIRTVDRHPHATVGSLVLACGARGAGICAYARVHGSVRGAASREAKRNAVMVVRRPRPVLCWDIYRAAAKAKWVGTIDAVDADAAIEAAAKEFSVRDPKKLIAVQRR